MTAPPPLRAGPHAAMALSVVEGALWAAMVGLAETYFVAAAVRLRASPLELGLVTALPLLVGSLGPLAVLGALPRVGRRRPIVVAAAVLQASALGAAALLAAAGELDVPRLLALLCTYFFAGQAAGMAWSSWFGDLVPSSERGRYFARRTTVAHASTFVGLLLGGGLLQWLDPAGAAADAPGPLVGFAVVFGAGALLRLISAGVLVRTPEPAFFGLPAPAQALRFLYTSRGRNSWWLLVGNGGLLASAYVSAPFFAPYMLEQLHVGYLGYMMVTGALATTKIATMPLWGRVVDRAGSRRALQASVLMSALIPVPWFWVDGTAAAALAYVWAGLAWGGYEVALFAALLDSTVRRTRPLVFAAHNLVNGVGQITGSMAGAGVLGALGFAGVFAVSLAGRLAVGLGWPLRVRELRLVGAQRPRRMALRVVGLRQGAGPTHRPVLGPPRRRPPAQRPQPS